jgi:prophage DNA circulation protein
MAFLFYMLWLNYLKIASFKQIPFKVDNSDIASGRRAVIHEYPQKEKVFAEDLGKNMREIRLEGWVIGENYSIQRDALLNACEEPSAGMLVHPYLGTLTVICTNVTVRESTSEGRMARFSFTFVETPRIASSQSALDPAFQFNNQINEALSTQKNLFNQAYVVAGYPSFVKRDAFNSTQQCLSEIQSLTSLFESDAQSSASFQRKIESMQMNAETLVTKPNQLSDQLVDSITEMKMYCIEPKSAINTYKPLIEFENNITPSIHPQSTSNQLAFLDLVQNSALLQALSVAANVQFKSWDEALSIRNYLISKLDNAIEQIQNVNLAIQFSSLRSLLILLIPRRDELPRLKTYTVKSTKSALVLAYAIYKNAILADQIVKQNAIIHPGFIPADSILKIYL